MSEVQPDPSWSGKVIAIVAGAIGSVVAIVTGWLINRRKTNAEAANITASTKRANEQFDVEFSREIRKEMREAAQQLRDAYAQLAKCERFQRNTLRRLRSREFDPGFCDEMEAEIDAIHCE